MKIAVVMPYFGKLPPYFNYYLRSLRGINFDVLFFSDLKVPEYPSNFKIIPMTFEEFKSRTKKSLNHDVRLDVPIRMCDFRPMYGIIFKDYLKEYDYWGFGDCDLVYGKMLNRVLAEVLVRQPDVLSSERLFCSGPLCFVKNTDRNNALYKRARNLDYALTVCGRNILFDEIGGEWYDELRNGELTLKEYSKHSDSFSAVVDRSDDVFFTWYEGMVQEDLSIGGAIHMSKDNTLTFKNKEIPLFHYVRSKHHKYYTFIDADYNDINEYLITRSGFYPEGWRLRIRHIIDLKRMLFAGCRSICEKIKRCVRLVRRH